jgi:xanthine phosphoribosyltransferase
MKQVFLSYHDIHTDCIELAKKIKKKYKPEKLILISRGGLIPGSIIANYLGIQDVDVIALKTYADRKRSKEIKVYKRIKSEKKLVVIDDLVDSGETAKIVKEMMPNSKFVVLYAKTSGKKQADLHLYDFKDSEWLVFPWEQD